MMLARVIETGELGYPNPLGLAYSPNANAFLVVSGSANDAAAAEIGVIGHSWTEDSTSVWIAAGVSGPINMAFDSPTSRLLIIEPGYTPGSRKGFRFDDDGTVMRFPRTWRISGECWLQHTVRIS